jgi:hypothetical protein
MSRHGDDDDDHQLTSPFSCRNLALLPILPRMISGVITTPS